MSEDEERTLEFVSRTPREEAPAPAPAPSSAPSSARAPSDRKMVVFEGVAAPDAAGDSGEEKQALRAASADSPSRWWQPQAQDRYALLTARSSVAGGPSTLASTLGNVSRRVTMSAAGTDAQLDQLDVERSAQELPGSRGRRTTVLGAGAAFEEQIDNVDDENPPDKEAPAAAPGEAPAWPASSPGARSEKLTFWGRSDSISDERIPMMLAAMAPTQAEQDDGVLKNGDIVQAIELEPDFYALSLSPQAPCWAAFTAPPASAATQLAVLYFLAFQNENMFEEGKWKQPISPYWSLNVMKLISIAVSLFKVSTELQHAQQLCRSLLVGRFVEDFRKAAGWWALALQYFTALLVLFVSLSIVLGATSCVGCFLKIFSVFIIVDMDNLAAKFVLGMVFLDFHVEIDLERLRSYRDRRKSLFGGLSIRTVFLIMPVILILGSWAASLYFNTTPLTLLAFGKVDNQHAPKMINIGACCPPILRLQHQKGSDSGTMVNVSVLMLASIDSQDGVKAAPRLYWTALESQAQPMTPSSLQVLQGKDANNNEAYQFGSAETIRSQSYAWLDHNHLTKVASTYKALLKQEKMYKTMEPYEATFLIPGIQAGIATTYTVFVTAQNPASGALASQPTKSSLLIAGCAAFCESCELAGAKFCDPDRCIEGTHYHSGRCYPCVENCDNCDFQATPLDFGAVNMTDKEEIACDYGGCKAGFGLQSGRCLPCKVKNCQDCAQDLSSCALCMPGLGLDPNGTCQECGGPHCRCIEKGGCEECEEGWGPAENASCMKCAPGCQACSTSHLTCKSCEIGYVHQDGHCAQCVPHCRNCSVSGLKSCDECFPGFGLNGFTMKCDSCQMEHCLKCNGDQRRCTECEDGFGVTPQGLCQDCGEYCTTCESINDCKVCQPGFTSLDGQCRSCADRCNVCTKAGPAKCDHCFQGFHLTEEGICERGAEKLYLH